MIHFTNWIIYAYFFSVIGIILIIVYGIKFFLLWKSRKNSKSEKNFKLKMKQLKEKKKAELQAIKEKEVKIKSFSLLKVKKKWTFEYWKHWFIEKYFPAKCVLINMELVNGFHRSFVIAEKDGGFKFRDKKYIFDDDSKYYNMDAKLYTFDYHETITLPIKRVIPVTAIKKTIESTDEIDIEYAINPSTLQRFMTAKIAEGVMKGTLLDEFLRKLQMFIIVIMVTVVVHLALFLWASGILDNIQMPF